MLLMLLYGPTSSDKRGLCLGCVVTSPVARWPQWSWHAQAFPRIKDPVPKGLLSALGATTLTRAHCVCVSTGPGSSARGQQTPRAGMAVVGTLLAGNPSLPGLVYSSPQ